jgi:hypothetical protein
MVIRRLKLLLLSKKSPSLSNKFRFNRCSDNQHVFIPFAFDTFGFLALKAVDLLKRIQKVMHSNIMSHMSMNVVFQRLSFVRLPFIHV